MANKDFSKGIENAKSANLQSATKRVQAKPLNLNEIFMGLGVDTKTQGK